MMGMGVMVCGLNGCGKNTLGKALAERMSCHFIDNERLYFPKTNADDPYAAPRTHDEVVRLLEEEIAVHERFVFAAVKGDYGTVAPLCYRYAVLIEVPRALRLQRVYNRSYQKFGSRMEPGGDLYESDKRFYDMVAARPEDYAERWVSTLSCPIIRVDGRKPVGENIDFILREINWPE